MIKYSVRKHAILNSIAPEKVILIPICLKESETGKYKTFSSIIEDHFHGYILTL